MKKIGGKLRSFGVWHNPDPDNKTAKAALDRYIGWLQATDNGAGEDIPAQTTQPDDLTLFYVVNAFMTEKHEAVTREELTGRQFMEYKTIGDIILATLGKEKQMKDLVPADFAAVRSQFKNGPIRTGNQITWARSIFNWATTNHGIVIRFGTRFDKPTQKVMRKAKAVKEIFTAEEIRTLLDNASTPMKAMILLGINGGFGQTDLAFMPQDAVNYKKEVIEFDRPKTGMRRLVPLWKETIDALQAYTRPHKAHPDLFFVTPDGTPVVRNLDKQNDNGVVISVSRSDSVGKEFNRLLKKCKLLVRGFYMLRG